MLFNSRILFATLQCLEIKDYVILSQNVPIWVGAQLESVPKDLVFVVFVSDQNSLMSLLKNPKFSKLLKKLFF